MLTGNATQADVPYRVVENADHVCAQAEIGRVPQRDQAGLADQEIQAHRKDREDQHLGGEVQVVGRQHEGEQREYQGDAEQPDDVLHCRPNRPLGRKVRIRTIGTNIEKGASSGK